MGTIQKNKKNAQAEHRIKLQINQALQHAENIIATIREPLLVLGPELQVITANRSFYRLFSATPAQVEGKLIYNLGQGEWDIPALRKLLEEILSENKSFDDYQVDHHFPGLGRRVMLLNARRMLDGPTQLGIILLAIEDITERSGKAQEKDVSELRYRRLFETAQDGILILDGVTGTIDDVNPFLTDMLGYSRAELTGKRLWEIGFFKDKKANQRAFQVLQDQGYIRYEDLPLKTRDGRSIDVEFVSNAYPINGKKVIQCNIRDITERKHIERKKDFSELRYRRLFETAQDGILILDAVTGAIIDVNPFLINMSGYTKNELLGKKPWEISSGKDQKEIQRGFEMLQDTGYLKYEDLQLLTRHGELVDVELSCNMYPINGEKVIQCNIRDITTRKRAEQLLIEYKKFLESEVKERTAELRNSNRRLRSLSAQLTLVEAKEHRRIANVIHDGIGQELALSNLQLSKLIKEIRNSALPVTTVIDSLKEIQNTIISIDKNTREFVFEISPPSLYTIGLTAALHDLVSRTHAKYDVETEFEDDGKEKIIDDEVKILLFQMVRELVVNIIKHARAKSIKVSTVRSRKSIVIVIADDGVGFDTTILDRNNSTGFGLFSIRERLSILGGSFKVDSRIGRGTRVMIKAPMKK